MGNKYSSLCSLAINQPQSLWCYWEAHGSVFPNKLNLVLMERTSWDLLGGAEHPAWFSTIKTLTFLFHYKWESRKNWLLFIGNCPVHKFWYASLNSSLTNVLILKALQELLSALTSYSNRRRSVIIYFCIFGCYETFILVQTQHTLSHFVFVKVEML